MTDKQKTNAQLLDELNDLRQRIAELEKAEADHRKTEEKLRESEERFRAFMDNNPASIYIKDENDRHIYGNPGAFASVGKKPDEFIGSTTRDLFSSEVAARLIELDQKVLKEGVTQLTAEWFDSAKGGVRWRRDIKFPIKLGSGKKLLGGIALDITDLKQTEKALQESEERYRSLVETSPSAIMAIKGERFLFVNPAGARLLGYSKPEEVAGLHALTCIAQSSLELVSERLERLQMGKKNPSAKIELIRPDGTTVVVEATSVPLKLQNEQAAAIIAQDISERVQAERAVGEQLEFERLIADIAARLAQAEQEQLNDTIDSTLRILGKFLRTERAFFARFSGDEKSLRHTNIWAEEGISVPSTLLELDIAADIPWLAQQIRNGRVINAGPGSTGLPDEAKKLRHWLERNGINSGVVVPISVEGESIGMLGLDTVLQPREYPEVVVDRLRIVADMIGSTLHRVQAQTALQESLGQVKQLSDRLKQENIYLRDEITLQHRHHDIVGQSDVMKRVLSEAEQVAATDSTVLILGETGTGKELLAHAIHNLSSCRERPMLTVNCSALPPSLIENELFGREKGAYTGALTKQMGRFEVADGSTIFLDEITELQLDLQTKLLRVLEDGIFERLGTSQSIKVDVRVIAATNRDLAKEVSQGRFREDLYYRLNVFPLTVPPLRERREDIPLLVWTFVNEYGERMGKTIESIPRKSMEGLQRYFWPGNVRELKNVVERAMILSQGPGLQIDLPRTSASDRPESMMTLEEVEKRHITNVLETSGWRVRGKNGAAEILGLKPTTLDSRIKKLAIPRRPG
jgi:PAS domain S-box-containing protein